MVYNIYVKGGQTGRRQMDLCDMKIKGLLVIRKAFLELILHHIVAKGSLKLIYTYHNAFTQIINFTLCIFGY